MKVRNKKYDSLKNGERKRKGKILKKEFEKEKERVRRFKMCNEKNGGNRNAR